MNNGVLNTLLLLLCYSYVIQSHISFCLMLYGGTSQINLSKFLVLQKKNVIMLRNVVKMEPSESCKSIFKEFKICKVISLYICQPIIFVKCNERTIVRLKKSMTTIQEIWVPLLVSPLGQVCFQRSLLVLGYNFTIAYFRHYKVNIIGLKLFRSSSSHFLEDGSYILLGRFSL